MKAPAGLVTDQGTSPRDFRAPCVLIGVPGDRSSVTHGEIISTSINLFR